MKRYFLSALWALLCIVGFSPVGAQEMDLRIEESQKGFQMRWEIVEKGHSTFAPFSSKWTEEEITAQFDRLAEERKIIYFVNPTKEYQRGVSPTSTELYQSAHVDDSRNPSYIIFAYNLAIPYYNASLITLGGLHFLAMEAPSKESVEEFFHLLNAYGTTDLVRLTPVCEEKRKRDSCFPYWEGRLDIHPQTGSPTLHLPVGREIAYFATDCWENHMGEDPHRVIALVQAVRNSSHDPKRIAVHCHAGIGRTGTFIAAYALFDEIDRQLSSGIALENIHISIEKVVWELSLQRAFFVSHFDQYKTLYEVVTLYLQNVQSRE